MLQVRFAQRPVQHHGHFARQHGGVHQDVAERGGRQHDADPFARKFLDEGGENYERHLEFFISEDAEGLVRHHGQFAAAVKRLQKGLDDRSGFRQANLALNFFAPFLRRQLDLFGCDLLLGGRREMRHRRHVHQLVGRHVGHAVIVLQPAQYFRGLQGVHAQIVGQTVIGVHGGRLQLLQSGDLADDVRQDLFVYCLFVDLGLGIRLGNLRQPGAPEIEGVKFQFFPAKLVVPVLQPGVQFHLVLAFPRQSNIRHLDLDINGPSRREENAVQQNRLEAVPQLSKKPGPAVLEDIRERAAPKTGGVRQSDRRVGNFRENIMHAGLGADYFVILAPQSAAGIDDDVVAVPQGFHDLVQGSLNSPALVG